MVKMLALIVSQAKFECLYVRHVSITISTFRHVCRPDTSIDHPQKGLSRYDLHPWMRKDRLAARILAMGDVNTNYWTSAHRIRNFRKLAKLTANDFTSKAFLLDDSGSVKRKLS